MQIGKDGHLLPTSHFLKSFLIATIVPGVIGFYTSYNFLFTKYLQKKRIGALLIFGLLSSLVAAIIAGVSLSALIAPNIMFADGFTSANAEIFVMSLIAFIHGVVALVMKGFISWYDDIKLKQDLNRKNYEMELSLVKSQIDPHFLFNTLNNIDVLITKDPARASDYLNKLSDIMRFMLYETKTEKIPLKKELGYIEKFIELQKIRTANQNYVKFYSLNDTNNLMIAPMILIPFVENAFKHAENKKIENAINIEVKIEKNKIIFKCENNFNEHSELNKEFGGLGSELIKRRLILLYPNSHTLKITNIDELYKVELTLY